MRNYSILFVLILALLSPACGKDSNPTGNNNSGGGSTVYYTGTAFAVAKAERLAAPWVELSADSVYTANNPVSTFFKSIPAGYDNKILSFYLPAGYMVVFAENMDGTGQSACYVATNNPIKANLPSRLRNNISYIRCMHIANPDKKGTGSTSDATVQSVGSPWYYGWSLNKPSFANQQFVPMTWGKGSCTDDNVKYLVERNDIDHLLSFNEPDNAGQSNIPVIDTAIQRYKIMQKSGLRLGTPVVTQDQAFGAGKWLTDFMTKAQQEKLRIDYVAVHWYDWGNQTNNAATDSLTAERVFSRFVTYMDKVHQAYPGYPVWVTEYNANINRTSELVHKYFMKLSTEWMNTTAYVERYAYFFPSVLPASNPDNSLTPAGTYWKNLPATKSFSGNITGDAVLIN